MAVVKKKKRASRLEAAPLAFEDKLDDVYKDAFVFEPAEISTVLLAFARAYRRNHPKALNRLHAAAVESLELDGMADGRNDADERDDAQLLMARQPGGRFSSVPDVERAIARRLDHLLRRPRGIGPDELANRLVRMLDVLGVPAFWKKQRRAEMRQRVRSIIEDEVAADAGVCLSVDRLTIERVTVQAMRACGITKKLRAKPFSAAQKRRYRKRR